MTRYRNSPAVFAWELGNEPRCGADGVRNLPRSPDCTPAVVVEWAEEISAYIKSLDPWHLVCVGDEGFFNEPGKQDWPYNGTEGVDTEALANIKTVDFGTYHTYPVRRLFSLPTLAFVSAKLCIAPDTRIGGAKPRSGHYNGTRTMLPSNVGSINLYSARSTGG